MESGQRSSGSGSAEGSAARGEDGGGEPPSPESRSPERAAAVVDLADSTGRLTGADTSWLRSKAEAALAELGARGEVRVRVVGDEAMSAAHLEHMNDPATTDVLTFDLSDALPGEGRGELDLDVLVCVDEASRQATARGHGVREELLLYVVHAALHGLGHDDAEAAAFAAMHAEEDRVLRAIGVGEVFGRAAGGAGPEGGVC